MLAAYVFLRDGKPVYDDTGQLAATQLREVAQAFQRGLNEADITVTLRSLQPTGIATLVLEEGIPAGEVPAKFSLIEASARDVKDAVGWAAELAHRVPIERVAP